MGSIGDFWWLIFPIGGVVGGWAARIAAYNEKRRRDKIELERIKASSRAEELRITQTSKTVIAKTLARHDDVNDRWFGYELDLATLIQYPMMTDLREPLTLAFHRAKVRADDLRPNDADELLEPAAFAEYRDAVSDYAAAFDTAEREARRRRQADFSPVERERLERARRLIAVAGDDGATAAERQAAYRKARDELEGLIAVPPAAAQQLEQRIAGALEPGRGGAE
ncbi:hypothetical protein GIY30_10730 [Gordonia sp. HNM0687]|uniref:Uncharacterized protein n=1 Tax=Gordonia mangrovi TaxID=2665643 RepID=A0A6L7GPH2_9ACTN|nr:hypothetical protein [Gordonia mangrovi]MXP21824.1 hypothetical protein [Gordonia mangrovi]UVF80701.1 hypothetical protein NWF22_12330 [Gordonia mangrovi]